MKSPLSTPDQGPDTIVAGAPALADDIRKPASQHGGIVSYISIARPDHWFKNVFMLIGVLLGYLYYPQLLQQFDIGLIIWAFASTCLVASSNYVINEILDAPRDKTHPTKQYRPIPSGRVKLPIAYAEWIALGALGLAMAYRVNIPFLISSALLLMMGLLYNIPPIRTKELPYLDVLSESINNPLRLALGWFVVDSTMIPPMSVIIAYWMVGAFFMAAKRFAEYREIADPVRAAAYRSSFRHYTENSLLVSMFFYATSSALMWGVFIIRYKLEQILCVPLFAGFFSYYMWTALKDDSPAQAPERLYREKGLMIYLVICVIAFLGLMFVHIPVLYDWFNVVPSQLPSLWTFR